MLMCCWPVRCYGAAPRTLTRCCAWSTTTTSPHRTWPRSLATVREMLAAGTLVSPQLVLDRLNQAGVHRPVHAALIAAATAGGYPEAVRDYAAAVVAGSLRRRVESDGTAMVEAAQVCSEADLPVLVANIAATVSAIAARLATLRDVTP